MNVLLVSNSFMVCETLENLFKVVLDVKGIKVLPSLSMATEDDFKDVDLTFVDLSKDSKNDILIIEKVKTLYKNIKVMILDLAKNKNIFKKAISLGVEGYMLNINDKDEFIYYIKSVAMGKKQYSSDLITDVLNNDELDGIKELTKRENEVMGLVAKGLNNREIAKKLYVTEYTVKKHVSSILYKLDFKNRKDIIIHSRDMDID